MYAYAHLRTESSCLIVHTQEISLILGVKQHPLFSKKDLSYSCIIHVESAGIMNEVMLCGLQLLKVINYISNGLITIDI